MNKKNKIEKLEKLRQDYLNLRELIIYYRNALQYNEQLKEKQKEKENVKVKKLVLTKPFYGKNLIVG